MDLPLLSLLTLSFSSTSRSQTTKEKPIPIGQHVEALRTAETADPCGPRLAKHAQGATFNTFDLLTDSVKRQR